MDRVVSGWSVSAILGYHSGNPTEVYGPCGGTAGDVLFAGCHFTGAARVNVVPGVRQTNKGSGLNPRTTPFWNPAAFVNPAPLTFGNEPRSLASARFYASKNEDFTIGKITRLFGDKAIADFRAEFFNLFNRHILIPSVGNPQLNSPFIPVTPGPNSPCPGPFACGFGSISNSSGPRTIQFGLNISY